VRANLFLTVPAGLAVIIGRLLTTLGPVQTYEHVPIDAVGRYRPAALLNPVTVVEAVENPAAPKPYHVGDRVLMWRRSGCR